MKFKIPIPDFSNSEVVEKRTTTKKKKVKSTQEEGITELVKFISDLNIKPGNAATFIVSMIIFLYCYGSITSSLNTSTISNNTINIVGIIPLLVIAAIVLGIVNVLYSVLGIRGNSI